MKYSVLKAVLITNSLLAAMFFVYFAFKYANWDVTICLFLLFLYSIVIILIYSYIDSKQIKKNVPVKPGQINNKSENDEKRYSNSYPSLGHLGEDEHDELTECERNYRNYLKSDSPHK